MKVICIKSICSSALKCVLCKMYYATTLEHISAVFAYFICDHEVSELLTFTEIIQNRGLLLSETLFKEHFKIVE